MPRTSGSALGSSSFVCISHRVASRLLAIIFVPSISALGLIGSDTVDTWQSGKSRRAKVKKVSIVSMWFTHKNGCSESEELGVYLLCGFLFLVSFSNKRINPAISSWIYLSSHMEYDRLETDRRADWQIQTSAIHHPSSIIHQAWHLKWPNYRPACTFLWLASSRLTTPSTVMMHRWHEDVHRHRPAIKKGGDEKEGRQVLARSGSQARKGGNIDLVRGKTVLDTYLDTYDVE